jgi:ADP-ribose pyrophosphatase YjhB (NUDIX family)
MIKLETLLEKHPDDIDSTSGVIIESNNKILIMTKTEGGYTIPKGHMRKGETPREAMHRELKEETQITLPTEPKFLYKVERPIEKGGNYMYVFHYLSDHELTPTLDHEHTDYSYIPISEVSDIYYLDRFINN